MTFIRTDRVPSAKSLQIKYYDVVSKVKFQGYVFIETKMEKGASCEIYTKINFNSFS